MIQEESGLFQVRFTEEGKKYIRKFAAISYVLLVLVLFENGINIYWNVKSLMTRSSDTVTGYGNGFYYTIMPYILIISSFFSVASNVYYLRFPRVLSRSLDANDEWGANKAFGILFKGAAIFLLWLLLGTATLIWSLSIQ